MKRLFIFHEEKFKSFGRVQQHKKCAELIRAFIEELDVKEKSRLVHVYEQIATWLEFSPVQFTQAKEVSDRYHWHLMQANVRHKEHNLLPVVLTQDRESEEPFLPISIYLDGLRSLHNIGSILRTCEALRCGSVWYSQKMESISLDSLSKSAMGTEKWVQFQRAESLDKLPKPLIALETVETAENYYDVIYPKEFTLAVGNEEYGLSDEVLQKADIFIKIPLYGRKNSLNVSNAFAIVASEVVKQRKKLELEKTL